ncbi:hypothetical protein [Candidatus Methylacidithermus pantelleriae]|uniref:Uncharacterized protein n=1 Tax=Candidatus Methylacidithermus pantelleriae TaxID=2744239 RepID=A0A8J2BG44_9BACT|nr:hypothetical protein [Candidatus Methylacidithermus pantelleriae]CAF0689765.1 hypothetical protein MPNT_10356 [Candidatus Methylacidithermus pantelleriae]
MVGDSFQEIEARKKRLIAESEALRKALEDKLRPWKAYLSTVDRWGRWASNNKELLAFLSGLATIGWFKRIRPIRRLLRSLEWGHKIWWLYRGFSLLRSFFARQAGK